MIGEFSERTGVSRRMLRHYDQLELLKPSEIDEMTGYRYYDSGQEDQLKLITMLSRLGFSLKEIAQIFSGSISGDIFLEMLKNKEAELRMSIDRDRGVLLRIEKLVDQFCTTRSIDNISSEYLLSINRDHDDTRSSSMEMNKHSGQKETLKELLAKLPGQDLFFEQIEQLVERGKSAEDLWTYITFDIDHFAIINDNQGYDTGDKVLFSVMQCILQIFSPQKDSILVSRLGGDEMGIFIASMNPETIREKVEGVVKSVADLDLNSIGVPEGITISAGVYHSRDFKHIADFRHQSTKALIRAKKELGRNSFVIA